MNSQKRPFYIFGLTVFQFVSLCVVSGISAAMTAASFPLETSWVFLGLALSFFIFGHLILVANRRPAFLELIALIACINLILAPWASYLFPASQNFAAYDMVVPAQEYFRLSVPAIFFLWLGMEWGQPHEIRANGLNDKPLGRSERVLMDVLMASGLIFSLLEMVLHFGELGFFIHILSQLRFVAPLAFMFTKSKGWLWRTLLVYSFLLLQACRGGIFYEFVLWVSYLFIGLAYIRKWKWRIFPSFLIIFIAISSLNALKSDYRDQITTQKISSIEKIKLFSNLFYLELTDFEQVPIGDRIPRWNQGWIISRVMTTVPQIIPYTNGGTILDAFLSAALPRMVYANKRTSGTADFFQKYTDYQIAEGTSMSLGVLGEMYINFGSMGSVFAMGLYGLLLSFIFKLFLRIGKNDLAIFAWPAFVMLAALEAESNFYDILNSIVKSGMVFIFLVYFVPHVRSMIKRNKRAPLQQFR